MPIKRPAGKLRRLAPFALTAAVAGTAGAAAMQLRDKAREVRLSARLGSMRKERDRERVLRLTSPAAIASAEEQLGLTIQPGARLDNLRRSFVAMVPQHAEATNRLLAALATRRLTPSEAVEAGSTLAHLTAIQIVLAGLDSTNAGQAAKLQNKLNKALAERGYR